MAKRKTNKRALAKKKGAKGSSKPGYDFIVRRLEKDRNAAYGDIAKAAGRAGHTIYPVMFGRAKAALGLVKVSARGEGKAATKSSSPRRRGPGRRRQAGAGSSGSAIAMVIASMREQQVENTRLASVLEKIRALVDSAV